MTEFDDFRVSLTPDLPTRGSTWNVRLDDCSLKQLIGSKDSVQPGVTRQQLIQLRSRDGWPNEERLKAIGQKVWQSLMTPELRAAFINCLVRSQETNRGMRLVVSVVGEEPEPASPEQISLQELPFEALYSNEQSFLAPNRLTPVSRGLQFEPDRETHRMSLPLRILVVVATPNDKPGGANMQDEKEAIQEALEELARPGGAVELEFCEPPTRQELEERLQQGEFHILHFIGHGGFDIVEDDVSLRPHLCLVDETNGSSDHLDAQTLRTLLLGSEVRLVVMTACSSAAPTPNDEHYHARAFDGLAQRLLGGDSGVSAVVAMQFDLESEAAVTFSRTFYTYLLVSDYTLDEVVARCRKALVGQMNAGHRAWVTPVVYWRCKDGKVFELEGTKGSLDTQTQDKLKEIDIRLGMLLENIAEMRATPPDIQGALAPLIAKKQQKVEDLQQQRGQLLGETLRLYGGSISGGDIIQCRLTLRLRTPARIGNVKTRVIYPTDKVDYDSAGCGGAAPGSVPLVGSPPATGELELLLADASRRARWEPGEYELAMLNFRVREGVMDPYIVLSVKDAEAQRDGADTALGTLDAVLFVDVAE